MKLPCNVSNFVTPQGKLKASNAQFSIQLIDSLGPPIKVFGDYVFRWQNSKTNMAKVSYFMKKGFVNLLTNKEIMLDSSKSPE